MTISQVLTLIGAVVVAKTALNIASFFAFYYLKPAGFHRFLHSSSSYALVTGATDGIGKALAKQLHEKGFNLIIHGRNQEKLQQVQQELKSTSLRDVRIWVADASAPDIDFEAVAAQWKNLQITLVIHNVGGITFRGEPIDHVSESELAEMMRLNANFHLMLTRALLPQLRKVSGPTEMIYIGSRSGDLPVPGLVLYAPTKAFLKRFSITLRADERFSKVSNVHFMYYSVGGVITNSHNPQPSLLAPTSDVFAKHALAHIGCGRAAVYPYMWHAVQSVLLDFFLPAALFERAVMKGMEDVLKHAKKD